MVTEGGRLEVPSRDALPGPDTANFARLDDYVALMRRCWAHIPDDRPTFQEIISELREMLAQTLARTGRVPAHPVVIEAETPTKSPSEGAAGGPSRTGSLRLGHSSSLAVVVEPSGEEAQSGTPDARAIATSMPEEAITPVGAASPSGYSGLDGLGSLDVSPPGSPYASTTTQTGSLMNPDDLNSGWASKLGSKFARRNSNSNSKS